MQIQLLCSVGTANVSKVIDSPVVPSVGATIMDGKLQLTVETADFLLHENSVAKVFMTVRALGTPNQTAFELLGWRAG